MTTNLILSCTQTIVNKVHCTIGPIKRFLTSWMLMYLYIKKHNWPAIEYENAIQCPHQKNMSPMKESIVEQPKS